MIVDFHCHLYDYAKNLALEISKKKLNGVDKWISSALSPDEFKWHLENENNFLFVAGIHPYYPHNTTFNYDSYLDKISNCSDKRLWGIGEIGLDTRNKDKENQKNLFTKQLKLSMELEKPVLIHSVKSYYEIYKILKSLNPKIPIIFHAFNSSNEIINLMNKFDTYYSINRQILNKKNSKNILERLFAEKKLLFETDANSQRNKLSDLKTTMKNVSLKLEIPLESLLKYYDEVCQKIV